MTPNEICFLFTGGAGPRRCPVTPTGYLLAADSGLDRLLAQGLSPHAVLGDFDSLSTPPPADARVFPKEKDDTDTLLCIRHALEQGFRRLMIYGGFGGREDHTFANYSALAWAAGQGATVCMCGPRQAVFALAHTTLGPLPKGTFGVFAFPDPAQVTIADAQYPYRGILQPQNPIGVSNFSYGQARVQAHQGSLLVFCPSRPTTLLKLLEELT